MTGDKRGDFWKAENEAVRCLLCPRQCLVHSDAAGFCKVRVTRGGTLVLPWFGRISALAVDPVEKKPLYHFHPGCDIVSVGFYGCTLDCPFCQNWTISREFPDGSGRLLTPDELVRQAVSSRIPLLAFTYSEPLLHAEYLTEVLPLAREAGLETVLVTNGMINPGPAGRLLPLIDALNIDLKGFNVDWYRRVLKGDLDTVCRFIEMAFETSHVEVTTLLVPEDNDSPEELEKIASFIASVSKEIPWHVSSYRPEYRYNKPPTDPQTIKTAVRIGRSHLNYVYTGNTGEENDTCCPSCGKLLVSRRGYDVRNIGWNSGQCRFCGSSVYGC